MDPQQRLKHLKRSHVSLATDEYYFNKVIFISKFLELLPSDSIH